MLPLTCDEIARVFGSVLCGKHQEEYSTAQHCDAVTLLLSSLRAADTQNRISRYTLSCCYQVSNNAGKTNMSTCAMIYEVSLLPQVGAPLKHQMVTLQPILSLELIPALVQCREHSSCNHADLSASILRQLQKKIKSAPETRTKPHVLRLKGCTHLIRMCLGNGLHIHNFDLICHDQLMQPNLLPPTCLPQH